MSERTAKNQALIDYLVRMGDNAIVLAQRLGEWVGHGPELEEELAMGNFALDYVGQARMLYTAAGKLEGNGRGEDDFAYFRDGGEYRNLLLLEQPNGDFGATIVRLTLFETFYQLQLRALMECTAKPLAEIAARAIKESAYHLRHAGHWLVRLGDGTDESHRRVQKALDDNWCYTGEMFEADGTDTLMHSEWNGPDLAAISTEWDHQIDALLRTATLARPSLEWMDRGGKQGRHSEHLGYLLAEMQVLQRSHPGLQW